MSLWWWAGAVQAIDGDLGLHSTAETIRDDLVYAVDLQLIFQESLHLL